MWGRDGEAGISEFAERQRSWIGLPGERLTPRAPAETDVGDEPESRYPRVRNSHLVAASVEKLSVSLSYPWHCPPLSPSLDTSGNMHTCLKTLLGPLEVNRLAVDQKQRETGAV